MTALTTHIPQPGNDNLLHASDEMVNWNDSITLERAVQICCVVFHEELSNKDMKAKLIEEIRKDFPGITWEGVR